ncbi:MAG: VIT and VWA domain-containing protein, partial [Planctomycetota bacterium]
MPLRTLGLSIVLLVAPCLRAQSVEGASGLSASPFSCVIVPQSRTYGAGGVQITGVDVAVSITEQIATTTMNISLKNSGRRPGEARVLVPVPKSAVIRGFAFDGKSSERSAELLDHGEARRVYNQIVAKEKDPALLEFVGLSAVRSSVFPVPAGGAQKVQLIYEQVLKADGDRIDYVLPRTENVAYVTPWTISMKVKSTQPISTVYSPSHAIDSTRVSPKQLTVKTMASASREPGSFRFSYLLERADVTASLFAYPDPKGDGGYFLLLAGMPSKTPEDAPKVKRDVTVVIDCSGSMRGEKIEQAKEAARQVIAGLEDGESFRIITYSDGVEHFTTESVVKTKESAAKADAYLSSLRSLSGTNLHDALMASLQAAPVETSFPIVLFLTDGRPTVGVRSERAIRDAALANNPHEKRVFTFGVGVDVNTPLLDKVATATRALPTYVLPGESVEVKVASVYRRLSGPLLAAPTLEAIQPAGEVAPPRVFDLQPNKLQDLFEGDQLVALGRYRGKEDLQFRLKGQFRGTERTFQFPFSLDRATTRHAFVPRLWASRKIGFLVDSIRDLGAEHNERALSSFNNLSSNTVGTNTTSLTKEDPRLKELVDEVVRLSTEFGVLTEYTAFLAKEGTKLGDAANVLATATSNFWSRAVTCRSGAGAVNQSGNSVVLNNAVVGNRRNVYLDHNLQNVAVTTVQQVCDQAFYHRNGCWIESSALKDEAKKPDRVVKFGTPEFSDLLTRLILENRQGTISLRGD